MKEALEQLHDVLFSLGLTMPRLDEAKRDEAIEKFMKISEQLMLERMLHAEPEDRESLTFFAGAYWGATVAANGASLRAEQ